jgi:hypothetical protein
VSRRFVVSVIAWASISGTAALARGQNPTGASNEQMNHDAPQAGWQVMLDGVVFATFNHQGGRRGDQEFESQNWFMAMGTRRLRRGTLTLSGMVSAEPFTVGSAGYSEIFQEGEAYHNLQVTDRQHPHDLFMQLAAAWHVPIGDQVNLTLAGGPRGEPALGPVAFMHRASSFENPTAPLSHHIFDSTHITSGVVTAGVDRGPVAIEASVFYGREPDEHRYDLEFGPLDSWSARIWFRPNQEWAIQASHGYLHEPEQLEPGDQRRTNGSVSWFRQRSSGFSAVTVAAGWNVRNYSTVHALLAEVTHQSGKTSVYSRFENMTAETEILLFPEVVHRPHPGELVDPIREITSGAVRDVANVGGFHFGVGADVVFYDVPTLSSFTHGDHPVSYHLFLRIRPPARGGRMWNMTMGRTMDGERNDGIPMQHHGS